MSGVSARVAERLFALLLWLLPGDLRREYGAAMRDDLRERMAARQDVWVTWLVSVVDLVQRAPHEWRRSRTGSGAGRRSERMLTMWLELGQALRSLMKRPGFTAITALTLALGIGATVAIFAIVHAVLVRPLPYPEPDGIVEIRHQAPGLGFEYLDNADATVALYRDHARSFSSVAGIRLGERNLAGGREPARVSVVEATPSLFEVLRVQVARGRPLLDADAEPGAPPVTVLTHSAWRQYFGSSPDIIGTTVHLNGVATEVVGVMGPGFGYPDRETAALLPRGIPTPPSAGNFGMRALARLAPGVDFATAEAEVEALQGRVPELIPDLSAPFLERMQWGVKLLTLHDRMTADAAVALWIVFGTVVFLLLVACASVANLFLVRAESRQREIGIRLALGATRRRVFATFMYESVLLGVIGGACGIAMGAVAVKLLVAAGPPQVPRLDEVSMDGTVLLFAAVLSVLAGAVFGAVPLFRRGVLEVAGISGGTRGATAGRDRQRVRKTLIVAQLALAIVLLTGSGLMLRSFQRLRAVDPGIRTEGVLTVGISVGEGVPKEQAARIYHEMLEQAAALPGVTSAGLTNALPLQPGSLTGSSYTLESRPDDENVAQRIVMFGVISHGFLDAMGTPLVAGRDIERADYDHEQPVVLINEQFAREAFGDANPIGERLRFSGDSPWLEVIGVVRDVRLMGPREELRPIAYLPMNAPVEGARLGLMHLAVRTDGDPLTLAQQVLAAVRRVDADVPLLAARTMEEVASRSISTTSFTMMILLVAAVVALLLGAVGLYGVIGYVVTQRTHEIGLRLALGAMPGQVRAMVLRQGIVLAGLGTILGLAGALTLTRTLDSLLFEVESRDPLTFILVTAVLLAISALAAYLPARRASTIAPMQAMNVDGV